MNARLNREEITEFSQRYNTRSDSWALAYENNFLAQINEFGNIEFKIVDDLSSQSNLSVQTFFGHGQIRTT